MFSSYVGSEGRKNASFFFFYSRQSLKPGVHTALLLLKKKAAGFGRRVEFSSETRRWNSGWHARVLWHDNIFPPFL